jgi:CheY-like chemotaxis protein
VVAMQAEAWIEPDAPATLTVLVIEDDDDVREALVETFEEQGYATAGAAHGQAALDYLRDATELPCLIVLDLMMPVMDGRKFRLAQLATPGLANIPVIILITADYLRDCEFRVAVADGAEAIGQAKRGGPEGRPERSVNVTGEGRAHAKRELRPRFGVVACSCVTAARRSMERERARQRYTRPGRVH